MGTPPPGFGDSQVSIPLRVRWRDRVIPSCVQINTNTHAFLRHLDGGSDAAASIFTGRFGGTVSAGLAGSSEQGRIPTRAMRVAAGSAGTKQQPSGPSLGMAANLGTAAAGAVLAAGRRVLGAPGAGRPTPPKPDAGRRGPAPEEFSPPG